MKALILIIVVCGCSSLQAQKVLFENDLVAVVKQFHPVAKQALIDVRIAGANLTASRGAFDPVASYDQGRKDFDGLNYYNQQWTELKIPTWYGIDVYAGTELMRGDRVNPEETKGTINYIGLSAPLLQNVIIDKRRAAVQQARILNEQSEVTRRAVLNDLLADALLAYWDWWEQYRLLQVVQASLENARARLIMVKTFHRLGERPAIDTLEAATQVQFFEQQETEAAMLLQKSRLQLSLYLWRDNNLAYDLPDDVVPNTAPLQNLPLLDSLLAAATVHPQLVEYDYMLKGLSIEKRLTFQSLLPDVRAKYNVINRDFANNFNPALFNNNYRFGLGVAMPLRLSEARGNYQAAKLQIEQTTLAQAGQEVTIQNKVKQYFIEQEQTARLYQQQQSLVLNYMALQKGEETRFANGESSLFLINAREAKTLEGQRKELELAGKIQKAGVRLRWAAGLFSNF